MSTFSDILGAAAHGAALVYHDIVAIEANAANWTATHPQIASLIDLGTSYATTALASAGVPVPAFVTAGTAVLAALKALAARDPTVSTLGPAPAPVVAAVTSALAA